MSKNTSTVPATAATTATRVGVHVMGRWLAPFDPREPFVLHLPAPHTQSALCGQWLPLLRTAIDAETSPYRCPVCVLRDCVFPERHRRRPGSVADTPTGRGRPRGDDVTRWRAALKHLRRQRNRGLVATRIVDRDRRDPHHRPRVRTTHTLAPGR